MSTAVPTKMLTLSPEVSRAILAQVAIIRVDISHLQQSAAACNSILECYHFSPDEPNMWTYKLALANDLVALLEMQLECTGELVGKLEYGVATEDDVVEFLVWFREQKDVLSEDKRARLLRNRGHDGTELYELGYGTECGCGVPYWAVM
jgi:hypothetical protein